MITVDTSTLTSAASALRSSSTGISAELSQLESKSNALAGAWSGDAQQAYAHAHREWTRSLDELRQLLDSAAAAADAAADRYAQTEQRLAAQWQL